MSPQVAPVTGPQARIRHVHVTELDSTSRYARTLIDHAAISPHERAIVIRADSQTGGVGRFGRPWFSPLGGLWCTICVPKCQGSKHALAGLGLRIGVSCTEFVRDLMPRELQPDVRLKWPNDVLLRGGKVLGVLCELARGRSNVEWVMVGVGLNANFDPAELPEILQGPATTLKHHTGTAIDLSGACDGLAHRVLKVIERSSGSDRLSAAELAEANALLVGIGKESMITAPSGGRVPAIFRGLDELGRASFRSDQAEFVVSAFAP